MTGRTVCARHGLAWVDLLLYRDFNGLALCQYLLLLISEEVGSFPSVDVHGCHLGKRCRADCTGNHMEEGEQVGMHRGCCFRVCCRYHRLVGDHCHPQRRCHQRHGESVIHLLSIPMLRFDLRPAEEITKCSRVILQRLVLEGSSLPSLLTL